LGVETDLAAICKTFFSADLFPKAPAPGSSTRKILWS